MHPALWTLIRLSGKASLRRLLRGAKTVRGALVLLFLVGGIGLWLALVVGTTIVVSLGADPEVLRQAGSAAPYLSLVLMAIFLRTILGGGGAADLYFSPAEIDFLFPAPFHRRELLLLKLYRKGLGIVLVALLLSSTPMVFLFGGWLPAFVGLTLSLAFVNLASLAATLARLIVAEVVHTRARMAVLVAVTTLAAAALPQTIRRTPVFRLADLALTFRSTWPGRMLLAPFEIFSNAMLADRWFPDLIGWAGAAAAIDLALLILVLKLDADYLERSAAISQWMYERLQRIRRSGGFAVDPSRQARGFHIPRFPWMGGAGPVAWRQMVLTARKTRGMARMVLTFTILILAWNYYASGQPGRAAVTPALVLGMMSYLTYFASAGFPVAFRGDLDHLDFLKTLPLHPLALTVGELAGCVGVFSTFQILILAIFWAAAPSGGWMLLAAAVLAPPVNWVMLATGNLLFLLYPIRPTSGASTDLNAVGRGCLVLVLQSLILLPLLGIPAGIGGIAYLASGSSAPVMVVAALALLLAEAVPMTMLVARAFERFDPSTEIPA